MRNDSPFQSQMRMIRWRREHERFHFRDEIRIIPRGVYFALAAAFGVAQIIGQIENSYHRFDPPAGPVLSALELAGLIAAISILPACYVLLVAYINRDAARRGMHAVLWTLLAFFVPYLIGMIIYFLLREPLPTRCPQCGMVVNSRFNYCPNCRSNLRPACPECKREVQPGDRYCPYCGHDLLAATESGAVGAPSRAAATGEARS